MKKRILAVIAVLVMIASLFLVSASAEVTSTTFNGTGSLSANTINFTITADEPVMAEDGVTAYVTFHVWAESDAAVQAFSFRLVPSTNLELATTNYNATTNPTFYYKVNSDVLLYSAQYNETGIYNTASYTPSPNRYFCAAGCDAGEGISTKTELLTIVGKVTDITTDELNSYTCSLGFDTNEANVVAGNGKTVASVSEQFKRVVTPVEVTVSFGPLLGDLDGDKDVDSTDLTMLTRHVAGIETLRDTSNADMNKDGKISAADLTAMASVIAAGK